MFEGRLRNSNLLYHILMYRCISIYCIGRYIYYIFYDYTYITYIIRILYTYNTYHIVYTLYV